MAQQQNHGNAPVPPRLLPDSDQLRWFHREAVGREKLRLLIDQWLKRNGWSLAVVARLAELSLLADADQVIPSWTAGMPLESGSLVNHRGHLWEAIGSPLSEPAEGDAGWTDHGLTSRLHASGLNLYLRNRKSSLTVSFLLELGRLNEWVAQVKAGEAEAPAEPRLSSLVKGATVISDSDGPLGPEELLSIAGGRLDPPAWPGEAITPAGQESSVSARQLRSAAAAVGLDIIEDWPLIAKLYPSDDQRRLERLQQVLRGLAQWDGQQEEDEAFACRVLLERLLQHADQTTERETDQEAAASVVIPAVVRDISGGAS